MTFLSFFSEISIAFLCYTISRLGCVNITVKPEISHLRKQFTHTFSPNLFQVWKCEGKSGTAVDIPRTLCNETITGLVHTTDGQQVGGMSEGGSHWAQVTEGRWLRLNPSETPRFPGGIGGSWAAALSKSLLTNQQRGAEVTAHGRRQLDTLQTCTVNKTGEDRLE